MSSVSKYKLITSLKSSCPLCHTNVDLLYVDTFSLPNFFICWNCKQVREVGVDLIDRENT